MKYEYIAVRLVDECNGMNGVMTNINTLAAQGWRLLEMTMPGGWVMMERPITQPAVIN